MAVAANQSVVIERGATDANGRIASMAKARLVEINLPDFGMPEARPEIPAQLYPARIAQLRGRAEARRYDRLVVYADREHSASLSYLTGFDPRFEEALLVLGPTGGPTIVVGNECRDMATQAPLPMSYTHLRAHETRHDLVCRLLLEKK